MNEIVMKRIAFWGRFIGIVTMILGVLSALGGLFAFVIGAIPGVISVITGYFLYKSGSEAAMHLQSSDKDRIDDVLEFYSKYLLIQGILLIIAIVMIIIGVLFMGTFVIMGAHQHHAIALSSSNKMIKSLTHSSIFLLEGCVFIWFGK